MRGDPTPDLPRLEHSVDGVDADGYRDPVRRSSTVLVIGLALLLLGVGNWGFGGPKMTEYKQRRRHAAQIGGPAVKVPFRGTLSILDKRTSAHDLFDDADLKYEYYRVIARGGRVIFLTGLVLVAGALLRRYSKPQTPA